MNITDQFPQEGLRAEIVADSCDRHETPPAGILLKNLAIVVIAINTIVIVIRPHLRSFRFKELGDRRDRHHDSSDQH